MKAAQKISSSTQKFIEIEDIRENIVLLTGGNACLVVEVQATNFELLSQQEQQTKIASYAALLNSLSFSIQIIIRNKRVDISSYLKLLDIELAKSTNEKLTGLMRLYRDFIQELIKVNTVLDKKFYIVIPFSSLEKGAEAILKQGDFFTQAKTSLLTKAEGLMAQLQRLSLHAKILQKNDLVQLYYDVYNQGASDVSQTEAMSPKPVISFEQNI